MDCRTFSLIALTLCLGNVGCVLTQQAPAVTIPTAEITVEKKSEPERAFGLMMAYGTLKEKQANEPETTPEVQVRLREEACQAFKDALRIEPTNVEAFRCLARLYAQRGNYELAFDTYKRALGHHPKSAELWFDVGQCHNRRKDWPEAVKALEQALRFEPENRQVLMTLGLTLARAGQTEKSVEVLTRATGAALAHYNVARMQLHLGNTEEARRHLTAAIRENPNLASARDLLASLDNAPANTPAEAARRN
jgi:tetratricopeptide (TPR) repeat protein